MSNQTIIKEYFKWIEETVSPESALYQTVHEYLTNGYKKDEQKKDNNRPFLSVITRTQGKRRELLLETLLCMTGQSDTSFEILIMGHNLTSEQNKTVQQIIDDQPLWMQERIRLIPVNGGTRTTPLNKGFEAAKGEYITVLDDDDIVLDNWVETFHEMSKKNPGRVLHTYVFMQNWETLQINGELVPRACSAPGSLYCRDFDMVDELIVNSCPPISIAYPANVFHQLGVLYDESLTTTEDWEYTLRTVFLCGICNDKTPTAMYRRWETMETSETVHSKAEWQKNYNFIRNELMEIPIIMPKGFVNKTEKMINGELEIFNNDLTLYYEKGNGFSENEVIKFKDERHNENEWLFYADNLETIGAISAIRFDPCERGMVTIRDLKMKIIFDNGEESILNEFDMITNGLQGIDGVTFLQPDPQFVYKFEIPVVIKTIYVDFKEYDKIDAQIISDQLSMKKMIKNKIKNFKNIMIG